MTTPSLSVKYGTKTIQDFALLFKQKWLNLEPGFQRKSVWSDLDRRKLIHSLLENCPVPSVFLYRQNNGGVISYDVIDRKQRLETVLMFLGVGKFRSGKFGITKQLSSDGNPAFWDWKSLSKSGYASVFSGYEFQTVEVTGDLSDIISLFVRINSTGKRLTGAEKRNARFYSSVFLRRALKLAQAKREYFYTNKIFSSGQFLRMKHIELVCELMVSIQANDLIDKKKSVDAAIGGQDVTTKQVELIAAKTTTILNLMKRVFPDLKETRFTNSSDFYSLFMLVRLLEKEGAVFTSQRRNRHAMQLLGALTRGVAEVREQQKVAKGTRPDQRIFTEYLMAVQSDTDGRTQRQQRQEILRKIFGNVFSLKDAKRAFTKDQRLIVWHDSADKKCSSCKQQLDWDNFTIDHVKAHVHGGKTSIKSAALMCDPCNKSKGKRKAA